MDIELILAFNTGFLMIVLVILIVLYSFSNGSSRDPPTEWKRIKSEIEHEAEMEAEEELMPYKPPRLNNPTVKRL